MNRKVKSHRAIICIIIFYAAVLLCLLGPGKILNKDRIVAGTEDIAGETLSLKVDPGRLIQQVFIADGGYLRYLDIYVTSPESAGKFFRLMVYDETNEILYNEEIKLSENDVFPGYLRIPLGIETVAGRAYVWQLQSAGGVMCLGWQNTGETGMTNLGYYYVVENGEITTYEAQNILMRQIYTQSPSKLKLAALMCVIAAAAVGACATLEYLCGRKRRLPYLARQEMTVQQLSWTTIVPVFYGFMLYLAYAALVQNRFGESLADKVAFGLGILIAGVFWGYVFFAKREQQGEIPFSLLFEECGTDWAQIIAFAGVLWGGIDYMNALYQFYQDCAYRVVLLWAGFLLLSMCPAKELFGKISTTWLLMAGMAALAIYRCSIDIGDGSKEILERILMRYDIMIGIMAVVVLAALIWRLYSGALRMRKLNRWYAGALFALLLCVVLFRNTRGWPVYLAVMFALFYLFYLCWENKGHLLANFCNGVLLNFACSFLFCMMRRPFRAWGFGRYNFVFHTVTVTATYLTLVICVLTVRLFVKLREGKKLQDIWGTVFLYGTAVSLLFLTLSRTGYLAVIAVTVVLVPFVTFCVYREEAWKLAAKLGVMAAAVLMCLPVTYCSIRLIPAVYNDPYLFELEDSSAAIHMDEAADSTKYMSISRFLNVMEEKLFSDASTLQQEIAEDMLCLRSAIDGRVYLLSESEPIASASATAIEEVGEMSNGRVEIWGLYIKEWNLFGHELMGVPAENGEMIVHAHNTYLQVIHDFGLLTGLLFIGFGAASCVLMVLYAVKKIGEEPYAVLPLAVFIGFAVAGLVEWLFHPCNPIGFSMMIVFAPLLYHFGKNKKKKKRKHAN